MLQLVFNPAAGKGRARSAVQDALDFLAARDVPHTLLTTIGPGHATELAAATPPGSTVVAIGGDGTVHEVAKGLLRTGSASDPTAGRALAVLPLGSGDDFAFSLGISRTDLGAALERIVTGERRFVDLGAVNGEPFLNAIGTGFDAEVADRVRTSPRFLKGLAGYLYSVVVTLARLERVPAQVMVDGAVVHDGPALLVATQNGPRSGGSFVFAPGALSDDGLLDVVVAGDVGRLGVLRLLPKVMAATHLSDPAVALHRGRSVRIVWEEPRQAHADGELLPVSASYEIELRAGALPVVS